MGNAPLPYAPVLKGYRVTGRLGEGGMGVVWKAIQLSTHREVALKVMGAAGLGSSRARMRFEREVELSARLDHPGIAKVFDGGLDEGLCFYAMELVQGVALDQHVRDQKLSRRDILGLMQQVCRAVQHAHQKGIIHRDLKPSNVMITSEGLPKVLDFGLAKATEGDQAISLDGEVAGTPAYMSPEQAAGKLHALDTRSDVYTLGVILFHLLTGKFPHDTSGTYLEVMKRIAEQEPKKLRDIEPKPDAELQALLSKTLAHEPERRYGSAGELADDIGRYLNHEPLVARPPTLSYLLKKRVRKHRLPLSIASAVLILLIGTATWSYVRVTRERNAVVAANVEKERQRREAEAQKVQAETQRLRAENREAAARRELYFGTIASAGAAVKADDFVRAIELLESCPNELRAWEWHYLRKAAQEPCYTIRPGGIVAALRFSPRSRVLAIAVGNQVTLWDFNDAPPCRLGSLDHPQDVTALAYDRNGGRVATAGKDGRLYVFDPYSFKQISSFAAPSPEVTELAFTPDGAAVVCLGRGGELAAVNAGSGSMIRRYDSGGEKLLSLAVSDDGRYLAAGSENEKLIIWNWGMEMPWRVHPRVQTYMAHAAGLAFLPGGDSLVYSTPFGIVGVRYRESGNMRWTFKTQGRANTLSLAPGGARVAVTYGQGVALFDIASGRGLIRQFQNRQRSGASRTALSDDGAIAAAFNEGEVKVWVPGREEKTVELFKDVSSQFSVAIEPRTGRIARGGGAGATIAEADGTVRQLGAEKQQVWSMAWSPDGSRLACGTHRGLIVVYDTYTGSELARFQSEPVHVYRLAFACGGKVLLTFQAATRQLVALDSNTGERLWSAREAMSGGKVVNLVVSPLDNNQVLIVWSGQGLGLHDAVTGRLLRWLPVSQAFPGGHLQFSPDGRSLYGAGGLALAGADFTSGQVRWWTNLPAIFGGFDAVAVSPDGLRLATPLDDRTVRVWDALAGRELLTLNDSPSPINALAWSPDGSDLFCANQGAGVAGLLAWHAGPKPQQRHERIDVLALCQSRDGYKGQWRPGDEGALIGSGPAAVLLETPLRLHESYKVHLEVLRRSKNGSFGLILPIGSRRCKLEIAGYAAHGSLTGIDLVDGKSLDFQSDVLKGFEVKSNWPYQLEVEVNLTGLDAAVRATLDGQRVVDWSGPAARLSMKPTWAIPTDGVLGIGCHDGEFEFRRCVVETSGEHELVPRISDSSVSGRLLVGPGATVDLLPLARRQSPLRGTLKTEEDKPFLLGAGTKQNAILQVPVAVRGGYELMAEFIRTRGERTVAFILPHPAGQVMALFDSFAGKTGLGRLAGYAPGDVGYPGPLAGRVLKNGQQHKAVLRVEPTGPTSVKVTAQLDGKELYQWSGPALQLSLFTNWDIPNPRAIGLGTTESSIRIVRLELKLLDGDATLYQDEPAPASTRPAPGMAGAAASPAK